MTAKNDNISTRNVIYDTFINTLAKTYEDAR
jgi:hypothetical protein